MRTKECVLNISKKSLALIILGLLVGCQSTAKQEGEVYTSPPLCEERTIDELSEADKKSMIRVEPRYPRKAARKGISGYVKMLFDISNEGKPANIQVIESFPKKTFEQVSVTALSKWYYPLKNEKCLSITLTYNVG
tara:strand:- start:70 stop:477 length:408 start_codon:yes stop_codon:yes gene_type:complete